MLISEEQVLDKINGFLVKTGMSKPEFGLRALNDPAFVYRLEKGRSIQLKTLQRIYDYIDNKNGHISEEETLQ